MNIKTPLFQTLGAFSVGFVFAIGLAISGMTQPQKVISFLDLAATWNPALMFVMLAAIPVNFLAYKWINGKKAPFFDTKWHYPNNRTITKQLVAGAIIFGLGWGLGGMCPGPAIASISTGHSTIIIFMISMTVGMYLHHAYENIKTKMKEKSAAAVSST